MPLKWILVEYVSPIGIFQMIWEKISIISFLYRSRASSRNNLIRSIAPSYLFSSSMGGHQVEEENIARIQAVQLSTPYILTLLGACIEK